MQFPLDADTIRLYIARLVAHENAQQAKIKKLIGMLQDVQDITDEDFDMHYEIDAVLRQDHQLKMDHETRAFNEANLLRAQGIDPKKDEPKVNIPVATTLEEVIPTLQIKPGQKIGVVDEQKLNRFEAESGGGEWTNLSWPNTSMKSVPSARRKTSPSAR
jgi:hypothetical protein